MTEIKVEYIPLAAYCYIGSTSSFDFLKLFQRVLSLYDLSDNSQSFALEVVMPIHRIFRTTTTENPLTEATRTVFDSIRLNKISKNIEEDKNAIAALEKVIEEKKVNRVQIVGYLNDDTGGQEYRKIIGDWIKNIDADITALKAKIESIRAKKYGWF